MHLNTLPHPSPGPPLPLIVVGDFVLRRYGVPLTYPPGPLMSTQPLELCHPQYGS